MKQTIEMTVTLKVETETEGVAAGILAIEVRMLLQQQLQALWGIHWLPCGPNHEPFPVQVGGWTISLVSPIKGTPITLEEALAIQARVGFDEERGDPAETETR